jgi:O-antigen ligase
LNNFIFFDRSRFIQNANYLLLFYAFFLPIFPKISSVLMIIITFFALFAENFRERFFYLLKNKVVIAILSFYFMHILWMIGSQNMESALLKVKDFKYILYIIPFLLVFHEKFISKILIALISGVMVSVLVSSALFLGIYIPDFLLSENHYLNVPYMQSYTQYAIILNLIMGIFLYQLFVSQSKILYSLLFFLTSFIIFIIESRIGYLLYFLIVFIVYYNINKRYSFKIWLYLVIIMIVIGSIAWTYSSSFQSRSYAAIDDINKLSDNELDTSLGARAGLYLYSYNMIKNNIFFGVGTGDHINYVINEIETSNLTTINKEGLLINIRSGHNASLHSEYLDILGQFGIIGLIIFLNIFYQIARYPQNHPYYKTIQLLIIVTVLSVSFGTVIFITSQVGKIIILLLSLTLFVKTKNGQLHYS